MSRATDVLKDNLSCSSLFIQCLIDTNSTVWPSLQTISSMPYELIVTIICSSYNCCEVPGYGSFQIFASDDAETDM